MIRLLLSFLLALCSGSAIADANYLYIGTPGTYTLNVNVPNTRDGGNWAEQVDVYVPTGSLSNAQVIIPGATGTAYSIAYQFRVTTVNSPVTSSSQVNWGLLDSFNSAIIAIHTVAANGGTDYCNYSAMTASVNGSGQLVVASWNVFHQLILNGQSIGLGSSPYTATPLGVTITGQVSGTTGKAGTYSLSSNPGTKTSQSMVGTVTAPTAPNTTTSCNRVETNGQDDPEFYVELADWIAAGCGGLCGSGISFRGLVGFSNGGMMVNRMWCEIPLHYSRYAVVSGPQGYVWYNAQSCSPGTAEPYYGIYGALDPDLGICVGCTSTANNNWTTNPWQGQNFTPATINPPARYINAPTYFCSLVNTYAGSTVCSGGLIPEFGDGGFAAVATHCTVGTTLVDSWTYNAGNTVLQYVYKGSHSPSSMESVTRQAVFNNILLWEAGKLNTSC